MENITKNEKFMELIHELADIAEIEGVTEYHHSFESSIEENSDVLISITRAKFEVKNDN